MDVIKNDEGTNVGANIRRIRLESDIGQTDLVRILQLMGADITREALVKIEKGTQHIKVSQLKAIKAALGTSLYPFWKIDFVISYIPLMAKFIRIIWSDEGDW